MFQTVDQHGATTKTEVVAHTANWLGFKQIKGQAAATAVTKAG